MKEAAHGEGERQQDAQPAHIREVISEQEVRTHGYANRQRGEDELPETEAEKDGLLVVPDFFVNFDFDIHHLNNFAEQP